MLFLYVFQDFLLRRRPFVQLSSMGATYETVTGRRDEHYG